MQANDSSMLKDNLILQSLVYKGNKSYTMGKVFCGVITPTLRRNAINQITLCVH